MTDINKLARDEVLSHTAELVSSLENRIEKLQDQRTAIIGLGLIFLTLYLI